MKGKSHLSRWNSNLRRWWTSTQFSIQKKFKNLSSFKMYIAFEGHLLLHASKEARPERSTA